MSQPLLLSPGQRVGPYAVVSPLRSGGMATLYLARRLGPQGFVRPVALKVVHAHLSRDPLFVRMFVDEALLCARIRHPNVVHVEELGEHQGAYYLAMEYVDGISLEDLFDQLHARGARLTPALAVHIACALLEGLHATHTVTGDAGEPLNVVHRDVSPSNVLIDRAGHVKLIDFGVAKARGRAVETSAGTLKGKYAYMSPEQAFGREIDLRSDLYSLAIVLWELLAMQPLFLGDNDLALLEAVRAPRIPSLSTLPATRELPSTLEQALSQALAFDPEERPQSARVLRQRLLEAYPEARNVDPHELGAIVTSILGPPRSLEESAQAPTFELGTTVASSPSSPAEASHAAATQAGVRPRSSWLSFAFVGAVGLSLVLWWSRERAASVLPPTPAAPKPPPSAPVATAPAAPAQAGPSLAVPPRGEEPLAPRAARDAGAGSAPQPADSAKRRSERAARRRPVEPVEAPKPKTVGAKDMGGVPIVEEPGF